MRISAASAVHRHAAAAAVACFALAVAACGGGSGATSTPSATTAATSSASASASSPGTGTSTSSSPTASATPTASTHVAEKGEPPVVNVAGFTYEDPGSDLDLGAALAKGLNSTAKGLATGSSTHLLTSSTGNGFIVVRISLSAKASALSDSRWTSILKPMVATFAGASSAKTVMVGGERMAYAAGKGNGEAQFAYAWVHGRVLTVVIALGPNAPATQAAEVRSIVAAYVAAQKS